MPRSTESIKLEQALDAMPDDALAGMEPENKSGPVIRAQAKRFREKYGQQAIHLLGPDEAA